MIIQKIAEIIEKNTQCYRDENASVYPTPVNAVPVNTLIRELCELFEDYPHGHKLFNAHDFTQTALGIQEKQYEVTYSRIVKIPIVASDKNMAFKKTRTLPNVADMVCLSIEEAGKMILKEDLWEYFIEAVEELNREEFVKLCNDVAGTILDVDDIKWEQDDVR